LQQLHQFVLPLLQERLWGKYKNWTTRRFIECHQQRGHSKLNRLPQADLISENQARATEPMPF
jgi:hypothetical protein